MSLLEVTNLSHSYGDKILYRDTGFSLYKGEHMGVVGTNGAGKSTLIGILTGQIVPDVGDVRWQPGIRLGHLDQHAETDGSLSIFNYLSSAFCGLYEMEKKLEQHYCEYSETGSDEIFQKASILQETLEANDFYSIGTRINRVAEGLGLSAIGMERQLSTLSGGQRAKVILAKLLLEAPDVLLLDEPTNFLDKEHIAWLSEYLLGFKNAFIVVSHDFSFLDRIAGCICDIEAEAIRKYHGSYSEYLPQKEHLREDHLRRYTAQQAMIQRTEEFIRRNIAGQNTKMAQGRRKQLERLERVSTPTFTSKPSFQFREGRELCGITLEAEHLKIGYDKQHPLLPALNFTLHEKETLVITGFNGIGKSTLLKTLAGKLPVLAGGFRFAAQADIGYYEQELRWEEPQFTPLQVIAEAAPLLTAKQIRKALADCGVRRDCVEQPIHSLSGGEQSKVKLCRMLLFPANILLLDEPTNHLDSDARNELRRALQQFHGSVVLVSHEAAFYNDWASRVLDVSRMAR